MPTAITEIELLARLQALLSGNAMGLSAILGDHGGILIERRGHMRGIWRCIGGTFAWTLAGYNEPSILPAASTKRCTIRGRLSWRLDGHLS